MVNNYLWLIIREKQLVNEYGRRLEIQSIFLENISKVSVLQTCACIDHFSYGIPGRYRNILSELLGSCRISDIFFCVLLPGDAIYDLQILLF